MPATARRSAPARREIFCCRHTTELKGLAHVLHDRFLDLVHLLLRVEEVTRQSVVQQDFAILFKFGDFTVVEGLPGMLLVLQHVSLFHHQLILVLGLFVGHKCVNGSAYFLKLRLVNEGLAQVPGLLDDFRFFSGRLHTMVSLIAAAVGPSVPPNASALNYSMEFIVWQLNAPTFPGRLQPAARLPSRELWMQLKEAQEPWDRLGWEGRGNDRL